MVNENYGFLSCARECDNPQAILQLFVDLTPQECAFQPVSIWSRQTKRKKNPCLWCILYTARNPETQFLRGAQARQLRTQINKCKPFNAEIVDYEFYENLQTGQPIIPMFTENLREAFRTLGVCRRVFLRLYAMFKFPFAPIYGGFPVKMISHVGKPIAYDPNITPEELQTKVAASLNDLIKRHQRIPGNILYGLLDRVPYFKAKNSVRHEE